MSELLKRYEQELKLDERILETHLYPKGEELIIKNRIAQKKIEIQKENENIRARKESGEGEEFVTPKKNQRQAYADHTLPDMEMSETDAGLDAETEYFETETATEDETEGGGGSEGESTTTEDTEDDDYFQKPEKRWKNYAESHDNENS